MPKTPPDTDVPAPIPRKAPLTEAVHDQFNPPQLNPSHQVTLHQSSFSGPIPSPEVLEKYNQILPGAAGRIITMAEGEGNHRRAQEKKQLASDSDARKFALETDRQTIVRSFDIQRRGQWLGFVIGTITISAGLAGALFAPNTWGQVLSALIGSGGVVALVSVFVIGQRRQEPSNPPTSAAITERPDRGPSLNN